MYIKNKYHIDPLQNHLFLFRSRKKRKIKIKSTPIFNGMRLNFFEKKRHLRAKSTLFIAFFLYLKPKRKDKKSTKRR